MELDREHLLAAIKAANLITEPNHKSPIFTKVWLVDDHIVSFNNSTTVFLMPFETPALGGIDGALLTQLLAKSDDDTVEVTITDKGQARFKVGRSIAMLPTMDPIDIVHEFAKPPELGDTVLEFEVSMFEEDIELDGMLSIREVKRELALDFDSLNLAVTNDKIVMYSSDRSIINRTILKTEGMVDGHYLVPLEYLRLLKKLWPIFGEGSCAIDGKRIIIAGEDDALFYTPLSTTDHPIQFANVIGQLWESGKVETKTLVPIPEELADALKRAMLIKQGGQKDDTLKLSVENNKLTMTIEAHGTNFTETMDFEHPDIQVGVTPQYLAKALPHIDRIYIGRRGIAVFGPKRFSRFIVGKYTP